MAKSSRRTRSRSRNQSRSQQRTQQRTQQRNPQRKSKGKTRKVNKFMQAKEKARKTRNSRVTTSCGIFSYHKVKEQTPNTGESHILVAFGWSDFDEHWKKSS